MAALSLGIDLGFSQPMEHVLRQCLIALRLSEHVGLDDEARAAVYYSALLENVGCHPDAHEQAKWFGDDIALKASTFDYEPRSAREALGMVQLLGAGSSPLPRLRTGVEFAVSGRHDVDDMLAQHASLARRLAEQLELSKDVAEAQHDDKVALHFNEVVAMVRKPETLMAHRFVLRVVRSARRSTRKDDGTRRPPTDRRRPEPTRSC